MSKPSYLESLERDGFVLIPSILTPPQIATLRTASKETIDLARSGDWPWVRTLPKQFPPWNIEPGTNPAAGGIWGVQFLMHPKLPNSPTFIKNYFSSAIIDIVKQLLECKDEDLVMELFNLLIRPDRDFELRWHRDDIEATATAEEELERLKEPAWHAQWNLSLYDDPFAKGLPGEIKVQMQPGDVVFYNNNILHRGAYLSGKERMTLHGNMGHVGGNNLRARNVLQHGIGEWVSDIDLSVLDETDQKRAEGMRQRLISMGKYDEKTMGYSLNG
jgi:hypothetical protein